MERFIPKDKLSKKARKALDARARTVWTRSPVTRSPAVPKAYDRNRMRKDTRRACSGEE